MKEISINELNINPSIMIGKEWMLISAGNKDDFNCMTASWGHIGALWGKGLNGNPTVELFVRPCRHTDKYLKEQECFSLSFFSKEYNKDLLYLGSHSGKDEDKLSKTTLTPIFIDGIPCYKEAKLTIIARKVYVGKIEKEGFVKKEIIDEYYKESGNEGIYNNSSFHNVYIGEIVKILVEE